MHFPTITNRCAKAPQLLNAPPWHADFNRRGLAKPDQGGKQEANGGKLAFIRAVQAFTCHGEYYPAIFLIRLAIRSTPSPVLEKAFIVMRFARNLAVLLNYRSQPRQIPASNHAPWHADRRSAQGVRSTTEGEIFKGTDGACADPDTRIFPATGGRGSSAAFQFYQLDFYVTRSLL